MALVLETIFFLDQVIFFTIKCYSIYFTAPKCLGEKRKYKILPFETYDPRHFHLWHYRDIVTIITHGSGLQRSTWTVSCCVRDGAFMSFGIAVMLIPLKFSNKYLVHTLLWAWFQFNLGAKWFLNGVLYMTCILYCILVILSTHTRHIH